MYFYLHVNLYSHIRANINFIIYKINFSVRIICNLISERLVFRESDIEMTTYNLCFNLLADDRAQPLMYSQVSLLCQLQCRRTMSVWRSNQNTF